MALVRSPHRFVVYRDTPPAAVAYEFRIRDIKGSENTLGGELAGIANFDAIAALMLRIERWKHAVTFSIVGVITRPTTAHNTALGFHDASWDWSGGGPLEFLETFGTPSPIFPFNTEVVTTEHQFIENNNSSTDLAKSLRFLATTLPNPGGVMTFSATDNGTVIPPATTDPEYTIEGGMSPPSTIFIVPNGDGTIDAYIAGLGMSLTFLNPDFEGTYPNEPLNDYPGTPNIAATDNRMFSHAHVDIHESMPAGYEEKGNWTITIPNWLHGGNTVLTFPIWGTINETIANSGVPGQPDESGTITRGISIATTVDSCIPYGYDPAFPRIRTTMNRAWNIDGTSARSIWPAGGGKSPA